MKVIDQYVSNRVSLYNGDSIEILKGLPDHCIHYAIFSPPFSSLYTYSNSDRDLGNSTGDDQFYQHFLFLVKELARVLMPGRLVSVHCMDIPKMKSRDGVIGLKDFPGELIREFENAGFIYHSRVIVWKDPLVEATRTKALGLMHKQLCKDSAMCRMGLPDYVLTFRLPGDNPEPVSHEAGLSRFYGEDEPKGIKGARPEPDADLVAKKEKYNTEPVYSHQVWRRYASPVWMDIRQSNTLNRAAARDEKDERHICPLQLDLIARCLELWTNPNDIVLDPFAGIGSVPVVALQMGRRTMGFELKESYFKQAVLNCQKEENHDNSNI